MLICVFSGGPLLLLRFYQGPLLVKYWPVDVSQSSDRLNYVKVLCLFCLCFNLTCSHYFLVHAQEFLKVLIFYICIFNIKERAVAGCLLYQLLKKRNVYIFSYHNETEVQYYRKLHSSAYTTKHSPKLSMCKISPTFYRDKSILTRYAHL